MKQRKRGVIIDGDIIREELDAYKAKEGIDGFRTACESLGLVHTTVNNVLLGKSIDQSTAKLLEKVGFTVIYKNIRRSPNLKKVSDKKSTS
jgi:uridylate kinase